MHALLCFHCSVNIISTVIVELKKITLLCMTGIKPVFAYRFWTLTAVLIVRRQSFPSLTISFSPPTPSEELLPCEQQGAREGSVTQPAGQRLLQQAAVDFLPAPSHHPISRQRRSG